MNATDFLPLLNHLMRVDNTPLDELDMIGSAVQYEELSPNWRKALDELPFYNVNFEDESKWTYALKRTDGKPIGFSPNDRGMYSKTNKVQLVKQVLSFALGKNRKLDPYAIRCKGFDMRQPYHPIHLLIHLHTMDSIGVSLLSDWYVDDDEDLCFPTHRIVMR